jgi:hypothetical protein
VALATGDLRPTIDALLDGRKRPATIHFASPFLGRNFGGWLAKIAMPHASAERLAVICWEDNLLKQGYVSATAVELLMDAGFVVHSLEGLHAKMLIIGQWAYVGSANLTDRGMGGGNHELGVVLNTGDAAAASAEFRSWFDAGRLLDVEGVRNRAQRERARPRPIDRELTAHTRSAHRPPEAPPASYSQFVKEQRLEEAIVRLSAQLVDDRSRLQGASIKRLKRNRAYRDTATLKISVGDRSARLKTELLLRVLANHPLAAARGHAAYRLGFDPTPPQFRSRIKRALSGAKSDQAPVPRRAASRSLTHMHRNP